jgi:hypothetical protein
MTFRQEGREKQFDRDLPVPARLANLRDAPPTDTAPEPDMPGREADSSSVDPEPSIIPRTMSEERPSPMPVWIQIVRRAIRIQNWTETNEFAFTVLDRPGVGRRP